MKRKRGFLKNIRLRAVAGVDHPAHSPNGEHEGWLLMKSADPVMGVWDEAYEDLLHESVTVLRKATTFPEREMAGGNDDDFVTAALVRKVVRFR